MHSYAFYFPTHALGKLGCLVGYAGLSAGIILAGTNVSDLPELDYITGMPAFIGAAGEIMVIPELPEGSILQLSHDDVSWNVVAEHNIHDWLGYDRLHPGWVYRNGEDLLVMDASPVYEGFYVPKMTVLRMVDGLFTPEESVTLASKLQDPEIFDFSINSITPLPDLLVLQSQVGYLGIGGVLKGFSFLRTDSGWTIGPDIPMDTGYWWPLHSEVIAGTLHLWSIRMTSPYGPPPHDFVLMESTLSGADWTVIREQPFILNNQVDILRETRPLISEDGSSIILFPHNLEFRKDGLGWYFAGNLSDVLDFTDLQLAAIGDGYALMRRGDLSFDPSGPVQHYHVLQQENGQWHLLGDLASHRRLDDYYYNEIFYILTDSNVTIIDTQLYNRTARIYDRHDLSPIISKWFADSQTINSETEWLPTLGYFAPEFSADGRGDWMWHWGLGWIYVAGRDSSRFYFWSPNTGWNWFSNVLFDASHDRYWLYGFNFHDLLWYSPNSRYPRLYFSYKLNEWISDTFVPPLNDLISQEIASMTSTFEEEGMTVEIDIEHRVAIFTVSDTVEGSVVTIRIEAPWHLTTGHPYPCMVRFEIDFSSIQITVDGQVSYINSSDLWIQEQVLMPMHLTIDFIFHTQGRGITLESIQYNSGMVDGPIRALFPGD